MAEDLKDPNVQVKEFDLKDHKWKINDKWYYLLDRMPPRRYVEYLKVVPEVVFNTTFQGMHDTLLKIWKLSTGGNDLIGNMHGISHLSFNQISAIADFDNKEVPKIFHLCAIIMVREGEDVKECDENVIRDKIQDFMNCEYSIESFFLLVRHSVPHFTEAYNNLQQLTNQDLSELVS